MTLIRTGRMLGRTLGRTLVLLCGVVALGCEAQAAEQPAPVAPVPAATPAPKPSAASKPPAPDPIAAVPEAEAEKKVRPLSVVTIEDGAGPLREQVGVQVRRAQRRGQRVFLEMGAPWCAPCQRVKALLAEPDGIRTQLDGVVLLRVNSDLFGEELDAMGCSDPTIPTFYALDETGAPSGQTAHGHRWKSRALVAQKLVAFLRSE